MIYLIGDCYKNETGEYRDVLKIGYCSKNFEDYRVSQYNTHNYGYRLIYEIDGDQTLEKFLHKYYERYRLSDSEEWFVYSQEIIDNFIYFDFPGTEGYKTVVVREALRYLYGSLPNEDALYNKYSDIIINELLKIYQDSDKTVSFFDENFYRKIIFDYFSKLYSNFLVNSTSISLEGSKKFRDQYHLEILDKLPPVFENNRDIIKKLVIDYYANDKNLYFNNAINTYINKVSASENLCRILLNFHNRIQEDSSVVLNTNDSTSSKYNNILSLYKESNRELDICTNYFWFDNEGNAFFDELAKLAEITTIEYFRKEYLNKFNELKENE